MHSVYNRQVSLLIFSEFPTVPSSIENSDGLSSISVLVGQPALLECGVDGEPIPYKTWYKDGEVLVPESHPILGKCAKVI